MCFPVAYFAEGVVHLWLPATLVVYVFVREIDMECLSLDMLFVDI